MFDAPLRTAKLLVVSGHVPWLFLHAGAGQADAGLMCNSCGDHRYPKFPLVDENRLFFFSTTPKKSTGK